MAENAPFQPIFDRIVVEEIEQETKTDSGIIVPNHGGGSTEKGEVLATGDGFLIPQTGEQKPLKVDVGDVILFDTKEARTVRADGDTYKVVRQDSVIGIL